jgi:hypothetical protein
MHFQLWRAAVEGGATAEARDSRVRDAVYGGADGIDAVGKPDRWVEMQVGRWITQLPSPFVAVLHGCAKAPFPAEQRIRARDVAPRQHVADARGRNRRAASHDRIDGFGGETQRSAEPGQRLRVAVPPLAETEVRAGHHMHCAQRIAQEVGAESFRCETGQRCIERPGHHGVEARRCGASRLHFRRRDAEERLAWPKEVLRVRLKSQQQGRATVGQRAREQRLMAEMHAVEIADSDSASAKVVGQADGAGKVLERNRHGRRNQYLPSSRPFTASRPAASLTPSGA